MSQTSSRCLACLLALSGVASGANVCVFGDFENGRRGDRPPEFWHWGGRDYRSAYPDWRLAPGEAASGRWCVTTTSDRPFVACGSGSAGMLKGTVALRAAEPDTKIRLRLSWWNRLRRTDVEQVVSAGVEWQRFELETEAMQGGPMELAVVSDKAGVRIWANDLEIEAAPPPDQLIEVLRQGDETVQRSVPVIQPTALSLASLQAYRGETDDRAGRVMLQAAVPPNCVQVPYVSGGVPFPQGRLFRAERVRATDANGEEVPCQVDVLSRWHRDRSVMVLLVTVPTPAKTQQLALEFGPAIRREPIGGPLTVTGSDGGLRATVLAVPREDEGPRVRDGRGTLYTPQVAGCRAELSGPLRAVLTVQGEHRSTEGKRCGRWVTRYIVWRGSSLALVKHCWISDEREPVLPIQSAWFDMSLPAEKGQDTGLEPKRHDGLVSPHLAVRDLWQNHPSAVEATESGCRIWLWPEHVRGVLIPQGFARQWEWLVDLGDGMLTKPFQTVALPVLSAEPEWLCASGVFEFLLPPDPQPFPIFERRVGSIATLGRFSLERKEAGQLYGVFNYGDAPGDGGWSNLESMAAHELFLHWVRTRSREHFDMARLAAEHYRDIDIHHGAGFCHTHCNNHVRTNESWSHSWIQGVRDLYFLLGDLRALEVLHEVGERLLAKPVGWTSGRDWTRPIDNLVDIYGATGDQRYLDCVRKHIDELGKRQLPEHAVCGAERKSWYEDRYPAGCAFTWYGCQAMAKLHQQTGDDEVLRILQREIDLSLNVQRKSERSYNVLPGAKVSEDRCAYVLGNPFALGRGSVVFPALGYLAEVTGDRDYLRLGMKILAHYMLNLRGGSDASATSYATIFLNCAKRLGIGTDDEAEAFEHARDFSYEQWPRGCMNGGFELDHFQYWSVKKVPGQDFYYDQLVRVGQYLDGKVKRSGRRALRIHSDNRTRVVSVTGRFGLKPRRQWRASVWVKKDETMNPGVGLSLREYDTDGAKGIPIRSKGDPVDGWHRYAGEFITVGRTVAMVSLVNRRGTGDVWFDDVSIDDCGQVYSLLTQNGDGRDWRRPRYPGLTLPTGGTYLPDERMAGDVDAEGAPISFTEGALTDGVSKYNHLQKPQPSYCYFTKRERGTITFDLKKAYRVRRVRVHVLIRPNGHGTQRVELRRGEPDGPVLAASDPAADGWNEFNGLDVVAQRLTLVLTAMQGRAYTTLSEVEVWGDLVEAK